MIGLALLIQLNQYRSWLSMEKALMSHWRKFIMFLRMIWTWFLRRSRRLQLTVILYVI